MKKFLKSFLLFALLILPSIAFCVDWKNYKQGHEDDFYGHPYAVKDTTATLSGATTFYGFGTDISLGVAGGKVLYWGSFIVKNSTGTLFDGDTISIDFVHPVSSPTIINYTLDSGSTLQIHIGGLKKDE